MSGRTLHEVRYPHSRSRDRPHHLRVLTVAPRCAGRAMTRLTRLQSSVRLPVRRRDLHPHREHRSRDHEQSRSRSRLALP